MAEAIISSVIQCCWKKYFGIRGVLYVLWKLAGYSHHRKALFLLIPKWFSACVCFFFPPQKQCKRLWCTSAEGDHKGCRTQHMPLADGTDCGHGMVSLSMYRLCEIIYTKMLTILRKTLRVSQLIFKTCPFENVSVDKAAAQPLV